MATWQNTFCFVIFWLLLSLHGYPTAAIYLSDIIMDISDHHMSIKLLASDGSVDIRYNILLHEIIAHAQLCIISNLPDQWTNKGTKKWLNQDIPKHGCAYRGKDGSEREEFMAVYQTRTKGWAAQACAKCLLAHCPRSRPAGAPSRPPQGESNGTTAAPMLFLIYFT